MSTLSPFMSHLLVLLATMTPAFLFCVGIAIHDEWKLHRERKRYRRWIERLGREREL